MFSIMRLHDGKHMTTCFTQYCKKCVKQTGAPFTVFTKLLSREFKRHGQSIFPFLLVLLHLRTFFKYYVCTQFSFARRNVYHLRTDLLLHLRSCFLRLFLGLEKLCAHMNPILSKCATQNVRNVLPPFDVHIRTSNKTRTQLVPSGKTIIIPFVIYRQIPCLLH